MNILEEFAFSKVFCCICNQNLLIDFIMDYVDIQPLVNSYHKKLAATDLHHRVEDQETLDGYCRECSLQTKHQ